MYGFQSFEDFLQDWRPHLRFYSLGLSSLWRPIIRKRLRIGLSSHRIILKEQRLFNILLHGRLKGDSAEGRMLCALQPYDFLSAGSEKLNWSQKRKKYTRLGSNSRWTTRAKESDTGASRDSRVWLHWYFAFFPPVASLAALGRAMLSSDIKAKPEMEAIRSLSSTRVHVAKVVNIHLNRSNSPYHSRLIRITKQDCIQNLRA